MATQHEIVGEEWKARATELADWAMDNLVNRKDVWGQYSVMTPSELRLAKEGDGRTYKAMTLPIKSKRGNDMVTLDKLTRHFASRRHFKPQLIGLHAKSMESTSRWLGIDIDCHDTESSTAEDHARRNLAGALSWWREFQNRGYDPLLFDSSTRGGYHLWVLLAEPAPTLDVFALGQSVIANWRELGLDEEPETFPKHPKEGSLGSWFRLPGLHHTRDHYATVWSGDEWLSDPWLAGHAAIDTMLQTIPGPPPPESPEIKDHSRVTRRSRQANDGKDPGEPATPTAAARKRRFKRTGKPTICVDLDGVLAHRSDSKSVIGSPVDGAIEFTRELSLTSTVIIYTARFSTTTKRKMTVADTKALEQQITEWLDEHGFAYDSVCSDRAKPIASAYVDDRAVSCRPVSDGPTAFTNAQQAIEALLEAD